MKKLTLSIGTFAVLALTGCSTVQQAEQPKVDKEPILVGIPFPQRLALSEKKIMEQRDIWYRYKMGMGTKEYEMVAHNTDLEARKGSSRTLPQAYAKNDVLARTDSKEYKDDVMKTEIKKIEWQNNSANQLGKLIADAMGYTFVVNKEDDARINLKVENRDVKAVVREMEKALAGKATVLILPENKTFNIIYK